MLSSGCGVFALAGTVNDADFVPIRGLLESCFPLAACCLPVTWQAPCVAVRESRFRSLRSDTAPAVYPCKGDGRRSVQGSVFAVLNSARTTFSCSPGWSRAVFVGSGANREGRVHANGASNECR